MKTRIDLALMLALALTLIGAALTLSGQSTAGANVAPARPKGPCDIYAAAGNPCVAAHSTTRALSASYNGPLYQVKRESDGKTLDIGLDAGGYANAAAQDAFCVNAICVINLIYDQSGKGNHFYQSPPGPSFKGPAKGGFDTQPIADMAPITIAGRKAYGVYIMPGMGFRNNNATGIAINDDPEGMYYVVDGTHFDSGCCFDYGNAETNSRDNGPGTMENTYFGTSTAWGSGAGPGPWLMADMEGGLYSGFNTKQNVADPTIDSWRFVTAVVDGGGGNKWDLRGANAQQGRLTTFYSGPRPGSQPTGRYYPMHKEGGILMGTGGDNGNGSSGTFYEGAMATGFPTEATTDAVQANVVAAKYDVQPVRLSRVAAFTPGSTQDVTVTFTNTTGAVRPTLSISLPKGWIAFALADLRPAGPATFTDSVAPGTRQVGVGTDSGYAPATFADPVPSGASVSATYRVTSPAATSAGFLTGRAEWNNPFAGGVKSETITERVRNAPGVKINEVRLSAGASSTNQFIELYNASANAVDLSNWTLIHTQSQWAPVKLAAIPAGTKLASHAFYLLGLSNSGLAAPASAGDTTINVRSATGFAPGQKIDIDGESRTIKSVGTAATLMTLVFVPVSTGPRLTIPAGSTNLPVTSAAGFAVGEKIGIDLGGNYELATVTAVGKAATQTTLSAAVSAGATTIKVAADSNITAGDTLTVGAGGRKELVKVAGVGAGGAGIDLAGPLKLDHQQGINVSDVGTGITFSPPTKFPHLSGDAVQALGSGIALDSPLARSHAYGAPVVNPAAAAEGYQGPSAPNQWFGGALSASAGSLALMDAGGAVVVDAMVYGSQQSNSSGNGTIASPELATLFGEQGQGGCIAVVPAAGRGGFGGRGAPAAGGPNRSLGRFPDGRDTASLCADFQLQPASTLATASAAGANNIKVSSVAGFAAGRTITIDTGASLETAVIAAVGAAGATTAGAATSAGATVIPVASAAGFAAAQAIAIDSGANREIAVVVSTTGGRGGATITVAAPLTQAHAAGAQVSGSGITLTNALTKPHETGTQVAGGVPTPGAPNQY